MRSNMSAAKELFTNYELMSALNRQEEDGHQYWGTRSSLEIEKIQKTNAVSKSRSYRTMQEKLGNQYQ